MKRKFLSIALVATGIVALSSCNNAQPKVEEKTTAAAPTECVPDSHGAGGHDW